MQAVSYNLTGQTCSNYLSGTKGIQHTTATSSNTTSREAYYLINNILDRLELFIVVKVSGLSPLREEGGRAVTITRDSRKRFFRSNRL